MHMRKRNSHDFARYRGVECVDGGTPALDAFGALLTRGVSALGVLNENGQLIANLSLSASDLRVVLPDRFGVLAQPVHRFLALECAGGLGVTRGTGGVRKTGGVITVRADATLEDAMRAIVAHNVHHVFVVSDAQAPLAVVSTTDVLRLIVPT
jgi:CBS domain-containing protein